MRMLLKISSYNAFNMLVTVTENVAEDRQE